MAFNHITVKVLNYKFKQLYSFISETKLEVSVDLTHNLEVELSWVRVIVIRK